MLAVHVEWLGQAHNERMGELLKSVGRAGIDAGGNVVQEVVKGLLMPYAGEEAAAGIGIAAGAVVKEVPNVIAQVQADRVRRAAHTIETAADGIGMTAEDFLELVGRDESHRYLLYRTVEAGAQAIGREKVRTLAAALASGAIQEDTAVLDSAVTVVAAVSELEAIHLQVLDLLYGLPPGDPYTDANKLRPWPWTAEQLYGAASNLGRALDAIVAKLRSLGMVDSFPAGLIDYDESRLRLTDFGVMCMEHLHKYVDPDS